MNTMSSLQGGPKRPQRLTVLVFKTPEASCIIFGNLRRDGMSHACLYSPAAERHRTFIGFRS